MRRSDRARDNAEIYRDLIIMERILRRVKEKLADIFASFFLFPCKNGTSDAVLVFPCVQDAGDVPLEFCRGNH